MLCASCWYVGVSVYVFPTVIEFRAALELLLMALNDEGLGGQGMPYYYGSGLSVSNAT